MPARGMPVTVNPWITIQLAPSRLMPWLGVTGFGVFTVTPASARNSIGLAWVPLVRRSKPV